MQHVRYSVKVFRQQSNFTTGLKHVDVDPHLQEQNHQCRPFILAHGNETHPQKLDHHIETYDTWNQNFGEFPHHLEEIAS
ncbi:hypothetical protein CDAR_432681 [Caerostris darwini]|uniref:Uncharacterized protein n=1 Tax=Caerostris darwini TaxID=1538125 RepID=A0AAV4U5A8_9ARAC|nr:hypothetical protein CDAR_432681 [Caerostris darwini]